MKYWENKEGRMHDVVRQRGLWMYPVSRVHQLFKLLMTDLFRL